MKSMKRTLTERERTIVVAALRIAAQQFAEDAKTARDLRTEFRAQKDLAAKLADEFEDSQQVDVWD